MRPIDAWKRAAGTEVRRGAPRVPRSHARGEKNLSRRRIDARTPKRREKNISAGAKARERQKKIISAGAKKKYYSGGSEKKFLRQREHNPQKGLRTVEMSFFYLFLSGVDIIYWKELQPLGFFLKVNAEDKKYSLKMNAKRKKYMMTDKS